MSIEFSMLQPFNLNLQTEIQELRRTRDGIQQNIEARHLEAKHIETHRAEKLLEAQRTRNQQSYDKTGNTVQQPVQGKIIDISV